MANLKMKETTKEILIGIGVFILISFIVIPFAINIIFEGMYEYEHNYTKKYCNSLGANVTFVSCHATYYFLNKSRFNKECGMLCEFPNGTTIPAKRPNITYKALS